VSTRPRKELGQHFLVDENILRVIERLAQLSAADVVLEIGPGRGILTRFLAERVAVVHAVEIDRALEPHLPEADNVRLHWGDALRLDLTALEPAPTAIVSNLPYSIATPLILRTIEELPSVQRWTVMVQREIADRLRAGAGSREYGAPSVLVQLACETKMLRSVNPSVFRPPPRVGSAVIGLRRIGSGADADTRDLVRAAFAHRRKTLARSLAHARPESFEATRAALRELGLPEDARAEALTPIQFATLARSLR